MIEQKLESRAVCVLCGKLFSGEDAGSLGCRYHPYEYVNRAANVTGYIHAQPPSNCITCSNYHQRLPSPPHARTDSGCTRIDHCTSVSDLLNWPIIALPLDTVDEFKFFAAISGSILTADLKAALEKEMACIVIDKSELLALRIKIDIPGTRKSFVVSLAVVYDRMVRNLRLFDMEETRRRVRLADPTLQESLATQFAHDLAPVKDKLHMRGLSRIDFHPFVIIARVDQKTQDSGGMHLVK